MHTYLRLIKLHFVLLSLIFCSQLDAAVGDADSFNPNANSHVYVTAVQADGKILVGGNLTSIGGQSRNHIARLNVDGSLDTSFNPNVFGSVFSMTVQADGKILVGGAFTSIGGQSRNRIARLNADGSLDTSFNPNASNRVHSMTVQADGKILVGGFFTSIGGQSRNYIARLNADGSLDSSFNPNANSPVFSMTVQADGKILVGGRFTSIGGQSRNHIARLNADGSLDASFNPTANSEVYSMTVQADGKILVGGAFTSIGGQSRNRIARLNADGSLDSSFNPNASSFVNSMTVQADGKILVGGSFWSIGGQSRSRIARLNADGSLDASFNPNANTTVRSMTVQADGKILVGGSFTSIGGQSRNRIARLENDAATQSILVTEESIEWQRGGSSPGLDWTRFYYSNDGSTWTPLGHGSRTANGWELNGLGLSGSGQIRALGYKGNGDSDGGSGIYETIESFSLVPANLQPIANAGADTSIVDSDNNGSQEVSLDGSSSDDTDGNIVSYLWEWQDGGAQSTSGVNPTITLPVGTTGVTLTVTDDDGDTDSDTVNITVTVPTYPVTFDLDGKGTRTGGGILNQIIQINQDATAPNVSGLTGWVFTGWDLEFTNITAPITVTALYTADIDNVSPTQNATVNTAREAPPSDSPPTSLEMGSLTIEEGGSFQLGANETLILNGGPLTVQNGGSFGGDGSISGDLNFEPGAQLEFSPESTLSVTGAVTMDSSFGIDDMAGLDATVPSGSYTLIDGTSTDFSLIGFDNWGEEDTFDLGGGKYAYFAQGSLVLVVAEAVTGFATWSGGAAADSDANGDGIPALAAYAVGAASPEENALQRLPVMEKTASVATYSLGFSAREDVAYSILGSADLATWYRVAHKPVGGSWQLDTLDDATPVYPAIGSVSITPDGDGVDLSHADPPAGLFFRSEFQ